MSDLWRQPACELAKLVKNGEVSAVEVTESALARIDEVNPAINAVVTEMPVPSEREWVVLTASATIASAVVVLLGAVAALAVTATLDLVQ